MVTFIVNPLSAGHGIFVIKAVQHLAASAPNVTSFGLATRCLSHLATALRL
jgi:hypothetical protein